MKYFSDTPPDYINAECEECGRVLKIQRRYAIRTLDGFDLKPPGGIRCPCGTVHHRIIGETQPTYSKSGIILCPHCHTRGSVTTKKITRKKGISGAKATGALLTGGLSIFLTGLSRKEEETEAHCNRCGAPWHFS